MIDESMSLFSPLRQSIPSILLTIGWGLSTACAGQDIPMQSVLPDPIQMALQRAGVPANGIGFVVLPLNAHGDDRSNIPVISYNADQPMHPASTMKLLTTMVALDELGPAFRWKTQILRDQPVVSEVLSGNLYLRGGGDPDLTIQKLSALLRDLRYQGVKTIQGNIILDRGYFQPERIDTNAPPFDAFPDAYYNVIPDALLINSNISTIRVQSDNDTVSPTLLTPLQHVSVVSQLHTIKKPCGQWETYWQAPTISYQGSDVVVTLNGGFPRNCQITQALNLLDRNRYIAQAIHQLWQELGGTWDGDVSDGITPPTAQLIVERASETLADTIRIVNKHSDNAMARTIFLTLGVENNNAPQTESTAQRAESRIRSWLFKNQINDAGIVLENGSGLSRSEQISARQMAAILLAASRSNWYAEFASSLPITGVDGTMRRRLKDSPAAQSSRIKTGTLKDSVAIAGYVRDIHHQQWIVVAMINAEAAEKARPVLDTLIDWVAAGAINDDNHSVARSSSPQAPLP